MSEKQPKEKKTKASGVYIALVGLNYGDPEKRVEAGEEVSDLTAEQIAAYLAVNAIKPKDEV